MIRALIFDCFGVLYSDGKSHIKNLCPADKKDELQDLYQQTDYGYISVDEFMSQAALILSTSKEELKEIISQQYVRNDPLFAFIRSKKTDFQIGLLSNVGADFFNQLIPKHEQDELFDTIVLSSDVGVIKPSVEIYEITAQKLGVLPDECIMTDDLPRNVDGANLAGMHGVLFTGNHQLEADINHMVETQGA